MIGIFDTVLANSIAELRPGPDSRSFMPPSEPRLCPARSLSRRIATLVAQAPRHPHGVWCRFAASRASGSIVFSLKSPRVTTSMTARFNAFRRNVRLPRPGMSRPWISLLWQNEQFVITKSSPVMPSRRSAKPLGRLSGRSGRDAMPNFSQKRSRSPPSASA